MCSGSGNSATGTVLFTTHTRLLYRSAACGYLHKTVLLLISMALTWQRAKRVRF